MKNLKVLFVIIIAVLAFVSCDDSSIGGDNNLNNTNNVNNVNNVNNTNNTNNANNTNNTNNVNSFGKSLDLLFVIDDSGSMYDKQLKLRTTFSTLLDSLKNSSVGMPDLHIGVTSTNMGSGGYELFGCENSNDGKLLKGENNDCDNPVNQHYIVDIAPVGCEVVKEGNQCSSNTCSQSNCDVSAFLDANGNPTEPEGLILYTDENGCPRCRNYDNEQLDQVFSCISNLGTQGCGFEQPLEAMYSALSVNHPENEGFLRDNAKLGVFFVTDEDDCSAENTELFNPDPDMENVFGPLTSFRCTKYGIVCDEEWSSVVNNGEEIYHNCHSRTEEDPDNALYTISKYVYFIQQLKPANMFVAMTLSGPAPGNVLSVGKDARDNLVLNESCGTAEDGAVPSIRLNEFVSAFMDVNIDDWAETEICLPDYNDAFEAVAEKLTEGME